MNISIENCIRMEAASSVLYLSFVYLSDFNNAYQRNCSKVMLSNQYSGSVERMYVASSCAPQANCKKLSDALT